MRIISHPSDFDVSDLYVDLSSLFGVRLLVKCEGFNFAASIKLKPARHMIAAAEADGALAAGRCLIESSSGNLGVALAMIAAERGYHFTCVTDANCNQGVVCALMALGAEVRVMDRPHPTKGYLGARLDYVADRLRADPDLVWINQYENRNNWQSHYMTTAREIVDSIPDLSTLFIGAGTTGTLQGCAAFMSDCHSDVSVVGIDSVGSVNFGGASGRRVFPGLGSAVKMPLFDQELLAGTVEVPEELTVVMSRELAANGYLFGASTCTV